MSTTPQIEATQTRPTSFVRKIAFELKRQRGMTVSLVAMNLTWLVKQPITTAFLGHLGELQLAGGSLGFTFANVTGYSVLAGLAAAMDPICGQAYGAKNFKLLHKTLLMTTLLLILVSLPISILWLNVDKFFVHLGQQRDMVVVSRQFLFYLLPDLIIMSFLYPLKAYLSAQGITIPILFSSTIAVSIHVPITMLLSKSKGVAGVAIAVWLSDLITTVTLVISVLIMEIKGDKVKFKEGGWWDQSVEDWTVLLRLCVSCCLTTCLEWWYYEVLVLLTGRLTNARVAVSILAIVLNFDYLLYSVIVSLSVCASTRVSNELGANRVKAASWSAYMSLGLAAISGLWGAMLTVSARSWWGPLFSHNKEVIKGVKKMMALLALFELVNFPLTVCGGIVRGMARPRLSSCANLGGIYLVALPVRIV